MAISETNKKYLIVAGIGVVSIFGAIAYWQYKKLTDYSVKFKRAKLNKLDRNELNFDVLFSFFNKSSIAFKIIRQDYEVFINNVLIAKIKSDKPVEIAKKSSTHLSLNFAVNPSYLKQQFGENVFLLAKNYAKLQVKIKMELKLKAFGISFKFPYEYVDTLENMLKEET